MAILFPWRQQLGKTLADSPWVRCFFLATERKISVDADRAEA